MVGEGAKPWGRWIGLAIVGILIIMQFFRVDHDNPPVTQEIDTPGDVMAVLEKSCYDCHSNKTDWPWYSYVAPASWLVGHDVHEAREHLNFTEWDSYTTEDRIHLIEEIWEEVEEGEMPLGNYLLLHQDAKLTDQDKSTLENWAGRVTGETEVQSGSEDAEEQDNSEHEH